MVFKCIGRRASHNLVDIFSFAVVRSWGGVIVPLAYLRYHVFCILCASIIVVTPLVQQTALTAKLWMVLPGGRLNRNLKFGTRKHLSSENTQPARDILVQFAHYIEDQSKHAISSPQF